jgi:hypothetical protein
MARARVAVAAALFLGVLSRMTPAAAALTGDEETHLLQDAETAMVAGQYERAIPLYASLFGETRKPVYLRNLGRCHQFLEHADQAILNFQQYLNLSAALTDGERLEVQGFIKEMEALKAQQGQKTPKGPGPSLKAGPSSAGDRPQMMNSVGSRAETGDFKRTTGYAVGVGGLLAVVGGAILAVTSANQASDAKGRGSRMPTADAWEKAKRDFDSAQTRNTVGWAIAGVGVAMVGTGAFLVFKSTRSERSSEVSLVPFTDFRSAAVVLDWNW